MFQCAREYKSSPRHVHQFRKNLWDNRIYFAEFLPKDDLFFCTPAEENARKAAERKQQKFGKKRKGRYRRTTDKSLRREKKHQKLSDAATPDSIPAVTQEVNGAERADSQLPEEDQDQLDAIMHEWAGTMEESGLPKDDDDSVQHVPNLDEPELDDDSSAGDALADRHWYWKEEDTAFDDWGPLDEQSYAQAFVEPQGTNREIPDELEVLYVFCSGGSEDSKAAYAPTKCDPSSAGQKSNYSQSFEDASYKLLHKGLQLKNPIAVWQNLATYCEGRVGEADSHLANRLERTEPICQLFHGHYYVDAVRSVRRSEEEVCQWYENDEKYWRDNESSFTFLHQNHFEFRLKPCYTRSTYKVWLQRQQQEAAPIFAPISSQKKGPIKLGFPKDANYAWKARSEELCRRSMCVYGYWHEFLGLTDADCEDFSFNEEESIRRWNDMMKTHAAVASHLTVTMALNFVLHGFASVALRQQKREGCVSPDGKSARPFLQTSGPSTHLPMALKRSAIPCPNRRLDVGTHFLVRACRDEFPLYQTDTNGQVMSLGHYSGLLDQEMDQVIATFEKIISYRMLGRPQRLLEYAKAKGKSPIPVGEDLCVFKEYVDAHGNPFSTYISGQMTHQLDQDTRNLANFIRSMKAIGPILSVETKLKLAEKKEQLDRATVVDIMSRAIYHAIHSGPPPNNKKLPRFLAHTVVADFECLAGYQVFGEPTEASLHFGYGCGIGIAAFGLEKTVRTIGVLHGRITNELKKWSEAKLNCLGLRHDTAKNKLYWLFDGREYTMVDTEHFLCKIGIGLLMVHPNRCMSQYPNAPSHYCWPVNFEDDWCDDVGEAFNNIVEAYIAILESTDDYPGLQRWFLLMGENPFW